MTDSPDTAVPVTVSGVVTSGVLPPEARTREGSANVWIIGDDRGAIVIDPAHDPVAISRGLGDRELMAVVCTHAHESHVNAAETLADLTSAPILLHPAALPLGYRRHPRREPDAPLLDGEVLQIGAVELEVRHTPGYTPGSVCLYVPALATVFTGDTLLGHGASGEYAPDDPETLRTSVAGRLFTLPPETTVYSGHGAAAPISAWAAQAE